MQTLPYCFSSIVNEFLLTPSNYLHVAGRPWMWVVKGRNSQEDTEPASSNLHTTSTQRSKKSVDNDDCAVQPKLWKLAKKQTLLQHSPHCPGVLKFKTRQLIAHSGFRNRNQVRLFYCSLFFLTIAFDVFFLVNRLCAKGKPA